MYGQQGHQPVAQMLLSLEPNCINAKNNSGDTCLHYATISEVTHTHTHTHTHTDTHHTHTHTHTHTHHTHNCVHTIATSPSHTHTHKHKKTHTDTFALRWRPLHTLRHTHTHMHCGAVTDPELLLVFTTSLYYRFTTSLYYSFTTISIYLQGLCMYISASTYMIRVAGVIYVYIHIRI
jgi:hypothetical protein